MCLNDNWPELTFSLGQTRTRVPMTKDKKSKFNPCLESSESELELNSDGRPPEPN